MESPTQEINVASRTAVENHGRQILAYEAGETIIRLGEDSRYACRLISGTARVLRDGDVVATVRPGEIFGAIAAITGGKRIASVIAADNCIVELIEERDFKNMLQEDASLLDKIL